jgi:hypothetical protein
MKKHNNNSKLNNSYTHFTTRSGHICTLKRPCYRIRECRRCLVRRFNFIVNEVAIKGVEHNFSQFNTLHLTVSTSDYLTAFDTLLKMRPKLHREIRNFGSKYVTVLAVKIHEDGHLTPHFHFLSAAIEVSDLKKALDKKLPFKCNMETDTIRYPLTKHLKNCLNYMLHVNMQPVLLNIPKGIHIITASKGISVGRPKHKCSLWWFL